MNENPCRIDHITVTAPTLESGVEFVRTRLGVSPQPGGRHPRMGTHNCLLKLGDALFLEVIAPDPDAARPLRPRWFELDAMAADGPPRLAMWMARTTDIHASCAASPEPLGEIEPMSRGGLDWLITIPADGSLPFHGCAPALIEWHAQSHPAAGMMDAGCTLERFEIFHPQAARLSRLLAAIGLVDQVTVTRSPDDLRGFVRAAIRTPHGCITL
jgi:hypothetical protein